MNISGFNWHIFLRFYFSVFSLLLVLTETIYQTRQTDIFWVGYFPLSTRFLEMCWKINKPEIGFSYLMYCISKDICLLFIFRDFYVTVRDNSGVRPELLCGQRGTFTFVAQKLRIDYKSNRYSDSWPGFQAQYMVIDESIIDGKGFLHIQRNRNVNTYEWNVSRLP